MHAVSILTLGQRRGVPHLWVSNLVTARAGFTPGRKFSIETCGPGILLKISDDGDRTVSRKERGARELPVIDINSREALSNLESNSTVRVAFGIERIYITPIASEIRRQRRLRGIKAALSDGNVLETAGICCGGGVLSKATHDGLQDAGIEPRLRVANEIREDLIDQALQYNDAFSTETIIVTSPLQELAFDEGVLKHLPETHLVELGLPCSGASVAGRAKRKLSMPEEHPDVGHLIAPAIALLVRLNPVCIIAENVVPYASSASAAILRSMLRDLGYQTHERIFLGTDWGELEARQRWCLVAMTRGIPFDLEALQPPPVRPRILSEIMDPIDPDDPCWGRMQYLVDKQERDISAGKGFRMQIYDGSEPSINTLTKGLHKRRSTDPFFRHPTEPELLRLPTVAEHARCKGIPEALVTGLCQSTGHELLGQSIVFTPFRAVARHVAEAIKAFVSGATETADSVTFRVAA